MKWVVAFLAAAVVLLAVAIAVLAIQVGREHGDNGPFYSNNTPAPGFEGLAPDWEP